MFKKSQGHDYFNGRIRFGIGQIQSSSNSEYQEFAGIPLPTILTEMYDCLDEAVKTFVVKVAVLGQTAISTFSGFSTM